MALELQRKVEATAPLELLSAPRVGSVLSFVCLVLIVVAIADWPAPVPTAHVRVRNASAFQLQDVVIGRSHYGTIEAGATTPYQSWGPVYATSVVSLDVGGQRLQTPLPEDHVGEHPYTSTNVTFSIDIAGSTVIVKTTNE